jgi:hypothetical protein
MHFDLFPYRLGISVVIGVVLLGAYAYERHKKNKEIVASDLASLVTIFLFSGAMCDSLFFLYCGLNPTSLSKMPEYPWLIVTGSLVILFHAFMQLKATFKDI